MERMDQRLDANERRIELRMDERLDTNERRIEQVLGLHQVRLDKHDVELSAQRRCWRTFDRKLVISGGMVLNRVHSSVNCPLKPRPLLAQRTPWFRESGVRKQCWYVVGPLVDLPRHKRLIVLSTRKWQMNCSLVCLTVCKTMLWSVLLLPQTSRSLLG